MRIAFLVAFSSACEPVRAFGVGWVIGLVSRDHGIFGDRALPAFWEVVKDLTDF